MTCIVALVEDNVVYMGGDSAATGGFSMSTRTDPKVFKTGPFLIGFTSSFRMGQILRFHLPIIEHPNGMDSYEFMVTKFIPSIRTIFIDNGYAKKDNNVERGGVFFVGYQGRLFRIDDDFQVGETLLPYDALGCGEDFALGSMYSSIKKYLTPEARIAEALQAAEEFSCGVRGPFLILNSADA